MGKRRWINKIGSLKFDRDVRLAMAAACEAAIQWGHPAVTPAHLLYGLADRVPDLLPEPASNESGEALRLHIEATGVRPGRSPKPIPYSDRLRKILAVAREVAFKAESETVGAGHVLAAIRSHGDEACAAVLKDMNAEADTDRVDLESVELGWVELSDESDASYHQQLADQIRDAIACGRLLPGQRLPTVRRLAESLDLAPGTVAKAYKSLETSGVVQTARSKGTTVALPEDEVGRPAERIEALVGLLRPVAVAAFHMGADLAELQEAAERAAEGVL